jgi:hypothetical protein
LESWSLLDPEQGSGEAARGPGLPEGKKNTSEIELLTMRSTVPANDQMETAD